MIPLLFLGSALAANPRGLEHTTDAPRPGEGRVLAVVVGIADFENLGPDQDLRFAELDARAFADTLAAGQPALAPADLHLLVGLDATHERVRQAVTGVLAEARPIDVVVLYFSTHGVVEDGEGYLIAWDTDPGRGLAFTSIPTHDIDALIQRTAARHVVLLTDACHAAILEGGGSVTADLSAGRTSLYNQASSLVTESSLEDEAFCGGHGAYTCALVAALQGAADGDADGDVTLGELATWMPDRVRTMTGGRQLPETKGSYDPNAVLTHARPSFIDTGALPPPPPAWRLGLGFGPMVASPSRLVDRHMVVGRDGDDVRATSLSSSAALGAGALLAGSATLDIGYRRVASQPWLELVGRAGLRATTDQVSVAADCPDCTNPTIAQRYREALWVPELGLGLRLWPIHDRSFQRWWPSLGIGASAGYYPANRAVPVCLDAATVCDNALEWGPVGAGVQITGRLTPGVDLVLRTFDPMERDRGGAALTVSVPVDVGGLTVGELEQEGASLGVGLEVGVSWKFGEG